VSIFRLIDAEKASYPVAMLCRMLEVSKSGYYAWRTRPSSKRSREDVNLTEKIREIYSRSRETYGYPRVHAELRLLGVRCGRRRVVARLMRAAGLRGCMRGKKRRTTRRDPRAAPAPDLLRGDFVAGQPNMVWLADITYIPTWEGFLYLAFILDTHSRRIVGWAMENHTRTELVVDALEMAVWRHKAIRRTRSSFRPRRPVHGDLVWQAPCGGRHCPLDGKDRNCPGQRDGGELHRHLEDRARASATFP
jgi:putative transposase